jgi:hypothetical protein
LRAFSRVALLFDHALPITCVYSLILISRDTLSCVVKLLPPPHHSISPLQSHPHRPASRLSLTRNTPSLPSMIHAHSPHQSHQWNAFLGHFLQSLTHTVAAEYNASAAVRRGGGHPQSISATACSEQHKHLTSHLLVTVKLSALLSRTSTLRTPAIFRRGLRLSGVSAATRPSSNRVPLP